MNGVGPLNEIPPKMFTFKRYLLVFDTATGVVRLEEALLDWWVGT